MMKIINFILSAYNRLDRKIIISVFSLIILPICLFLFSHISFKSYLIISAGIFILGIYSANHILAFVQKHLKVNARPIALFFLFLFLLFIIRGALFSNPAAWRAYSKLLSRRDVGWKQFALLRFKGYREKEIAKECKYLAVGSSLVGGIFNNDITNQQGVKVLGLAGLLPYEYSFYEGYIDKVKPSYLILYISELELARDIKSEQVILNPSQLPHLARLIKDMFQYSGFRENKLSFICTIIIAEVFPEYKYAFIYRGMLNKFMCLNKVVAKEENVVTKSQFEKYLRYLRGTLLNEGNLGINIKLLRDFISFCADKDIKVVILESQYISLAHAEKNIKLNQIVVRELNKLSREYKNVKFIPKSELYQFQNTDYFVNNLTHVTKEAALRYIEQFFRYMERSNF